MWFWGTWQWQMLCFYYPSGWCSTQMIRRALYMAATTAYSLQRTKETLNWSSHESSDLTNSTQSIQKEPTPSDPTSMRGELRPEIPTCHKNRNRYVPIFFTQNPTLKNLFYPNRSKPDPTLQSNSGKKKNDQVGLGSKNDVFYPNWTQRNLINDRSTTNITY